MIYCLQNYRNTVHVSFMSYLMFIGNRYIDGIMHQWSEIVKIHFFSHLFNVSTSDLKPISATLHLDAIIELN